MNVINQVGFGHGEFRMIGARSTKKMFILPLVDPEAKIYVVPGNKLAEHLNLQFFLFKVRN